MMETEKDSTEKDFTWDGKQIFKWGRSPPSRQEKSDENNKKNEFVEIPLPRIVGQTNEFLLPENQLSCAYEPRLSCYEDSATRQLFLEKIENLEYVQSPAYLITCYDEFSRKLIYTAVAKNGAPNIPLTRYDKYTLMSEESLTKNVLQYYNPGYSAWFSSFTRIPNDSRYLLGRRVSSDINLLLKLNSCIPAKNQFEPLFGSISIFTIIGDEFTRLSETFYFDASPTSIRKQYSELYLGSSSASKEVQSLKYVGTSPFIADGTGSVTHLSSFNILLPEVFKNKKKDIFIVIQISKILSSDAEKAVQPYLRNANQPDATKHKEACNRLSKYRQPVGIGISKLVDEQGKVGLNLNGKAAKINIPMYALKACMNDTMLLQFAKELYPADGSNPYIRVEPLDLEFKAIVYDLGTDSQLLESMVNHRIIAPDTSELPLFIPYQIQSDTASIQFSNENLNLSRLGINIAKLGIVQVMPLIPPPLMSSITRQIKMNVENTLFLYPLQFERFNPNKRNLCLKIQLIEFQFSNSEHRNPQLTDPHVPLQNIYNTLLITGPTFLTEVYTRISYHTKNPPICEEIKIRLPDHLTNRHALKFTAIHVHVKPNHERKSILGWNNSAPVEPKSTEQISTVLGEGMLPLMWNNTALIDDFEHSVAINEVIKEALSQNSKSLKPSEGGVGLLSSSSSQSGPVDHSNNVTNNNNPYIKIKIKAMTSLVSNNKYVQAALRFQPIPLGLLPSTIMTEETASAIKLGAVVTAPKELKLITVTKELILGSSIEIARHFLVLMRQLIRALLGGPCVYDEAYVNPYKHVKVRSQAFLTMLQIIGKISPEANHQGSTEDAIQKEFLNAYVDCLFDEEIPIESDQNKNEIRSETSTSVVDDAAIENLNEPTNESVKESLNEDDEVYTSPLVHQTSDMSNATPKLMDKEIDAAYDSYNKDANWDKAQTKLNKLARRPLSMNGRVEQSNSTTSLHQSNHDSNTNEDAVSEYSGSEDDRSNRRQSIVNDTEEESTSNPSRSNRNSRRFARDHLANDTDDSLSVLSKSNRGSLRIARDRLISADSESPSDSQSMTHIQHQNDLVVNKSSNDALDSNEAEIDPENNNYMDIEEIEPELLDAEEQGREVADKRLSMRSVTLKSDVDDLQEAFDGPTPPVESGQSIFGISYEDIDNDEELEMQFEQNKFLLDSHVEDGRRSSNAEDHIPSLVSESDLTDNRMQSDQLSSKKFLSRSPRSADEKSASNKDTDESSISSTNKIEPIAPIAVDEKSSKEENGSLTEIKKKPRSVSDAKPMRLRSVLSDRIEEEDEEGLADDDENPTNEAVERDDEHDDSKYNSSERKSWGRYITDALWRSSRKKSVDKAESDEKVAIYLDEIANHIARQAERVILETLCRAAIYSVHNEIKQNQTLREKEEFIADDYMLSNHHQLSSRGETIDEFLEVTERRILSGKRFKPNKLDGVDTGLLFDDEKTWFANIDAGRLVDENDVVVKEEKLTTVELSTVYITGNNREETFEIQPSLPLYDSIEGINEKIAKMSKMNDVLPHWWPFVYEVITFQWAAILGIIINAAQINVSHCVPGNQLSELVKDYPFEVEVIPKGTKNLVTDVRYLLVEHGPILLKMMYKSLALRIHREELRPPILLDGEYLKILDNLVSLLAIEITTNNSGMWRSKKLNEALSNFLKGLFGLVVPQQVVSLITTYFKALENRTKLEQIEFRLQMIQEISFFDHIVALNFPYTLDAPIEFFRFDVNELNHDPMSIIPYTAAGIRYLNTPSPYSLAYTIIAEIMKSYSLDEKKIKDSALGILRDLLVRHSFDARYQSNESQERIICMYLPLFKEFIQLKPRLQSLRYDSQERREILAILLYFFQSIPSHILRRRIRNMMYHAVAMTPRAPTMDNADSSEVHASAVEDNSNTTTKSNTLLKISSTKTMSSLIPVAVPVEVCEPSPARIRPLPLATVSIVTPPPATSPAIRIQHVASYNNVSPANTRPSRSLAFSSTDLEDVDGSRMQTLSCASVELSESPSVAPKLNRNSLPRIISLKPIKNVFASMSHLLLPMAHEVPSFFQQTYLSNLPINNLLMLLHLMLDTFESPCKPNAIVNGTANTTPANEIPQRSLLASQQSKTGVSVSNLTPITTPKANNTQDSSTSNIIDKNYMQVLSPGVEILDDVATNPVEVRGITGISRGRSIRGAEVDNQTKRRASTGLALLDQSLQSKKSKYPDSMRRVSDVAAPGVVKGEERKWLQMTRLASDRVLREKSVLPQPIDSVTMIHAATHVSYASTGLVMKMLLILLEECPAIISNQIPDEFNPNIYNLRNSNITESVLVGIKDLRIIEFIKMALSVLLHAFYCNQEFEAIINIFSAARTVIRRFGAKIFFASVEDSLQYWMRITLFHCGSSHASVRDSGCNFLLYLMRACFHYLGSITLISNTILAVINDVISTILDVNWNKSTTIGDEDRTLQVLVESIVKMKSACETKFDASDDLIADTTLKSIKAPFCIAVMQLMMDLQIILVANSSLRRYVTQPVGYDFNGGNLLDPDDRTFPLAQSFIRRRKIVKPDVNSVNQSKSTFQMDDVLIQFLQAAEVYDPIKLPRFRMHWLENLVRLQESRSNKAEAAETRWRIFLLCQLVENVWQEEWVPRPPLEWRQRGVPELPVDKGTDINGSSTNNIPAVAEISHAEDRNFYNVLVTALDGSVNRAWTDQYQYLNHMKTVLTAITESFCRLNLIHLAERSLYQLVQFYRLSKKTELISAEYLKLANAIKATSEKGVTNLMALGTFYRVCYEGEGVPNFVRSREFIFRNATNMHVSEYQKLVFDALKQIMREGVEIKHVTELGPNCILNDPKLAYVLMNSVKVISNVPKTNARISLQRKTNNSIQGGTLQATLYRSQPESISVEMLDQVSAFQYNTPFTLGGKSQAKHIEDQWIRNTKLYVKEPFPFILTRQQVIRRDVVELSPIEASMLDIEERIEAMDAELEKESKVSNNLQRIIQGTVLPQVNAGLAEVAKVFLDPTRKVANILALRTQNEILQQQQDQLNSANRVMSEEPLLHHTPSHLRISNSNSFGSNSSQSSDASQPNFDALLNVQSSSGFRKNYGTVVNEEKLYNELELKLKLTLIECLSRAKLLLAKARRVLLSESTVTDGNNNLGERPLSGVGNDLHILPTILPANTVGQPEKNTINNEMYNTNLIWQTEMERGFDNLLTSILPYIKDMKESQLLLSSSSSLPPLSSSSMTTSIHTMR